jgi:hypothetical protein
MSTFILGGSKMKEIPYKISVFKNLHYVIFEMKSSASRKLTK